jgi:hypothetical protein
MESPEMEVLGWPAMCTHRAAHLAVADSSRTYLGGPRCNPAQARSKGHALWLAGQVGARSEEVYWGLLAVIN